MKKSFKFLCGFMAVLMATLALTACGGGASVDSGYWTRNTYANESIGITFDVPAGWNRVSGADFGTVLEVGSEASDIPANAWTDDELLVFAAASSESEMSTVIIGAERASGRVSASRSLNLIVDELEAGGMTARRVPGTTRIGEHDWYLIEAEMEMFGITMLSHTYFRAQGRYGISIIIVTVDMAGVETPAQILRMFD